MCLKETKQSYAYSVCYIKEPCAPCWAEIPVLYSDVKVTVGYSAGHSMVHSVEMWVGGWAGLAGLGQLQLFFRAVVIAWRDNFGFCQWILCLLGLLPKLKDKLERRAWEKMWGKGWWVQAQDQVLGSSWWQKYFLYMRLSYLLFSACLFHSLSFSLEDDSTPTWLNILKIEHLVCFQSCVFVRRNT